MSPGDGAQAESTTPPAPREILEPGGGRSREMPQVSQPVAPTRTHWGCPHNAHPLCLRGYSHPGLSGQGSWIGSCLGSCQSIEMYPLPSQGTWQRHCCPLPSGPSSVPACGWAAQQAEGGSRVPSGLRPAHPTRSVLPVLCPNAQALSTLPREAARKRARSTGPQRRSPASRTGGKPMSPSGRVGWEQRGGVASGAAQQKQGCGHAG